MPARRSMNFLNHRQPISVEPHCEPHQRRPQSAMDIGHLTPNETTHQHVGRFTDRAGAKEDGVGLGVRPPTPADWCASDSRGRVLTQNRRISQPKPSSPNGIQTKCNWVNRALRKPLKTSGFENGPCRACVNSRSYFSCNRLIRGPERDSNLVIYLTSHAV